MWKGKIENSVQKIPKCGNCNNLCIHSGGESNSENPYCVEVDIMSSCVKGKMCLVISVQNQTCLNARLVCIFLDRDVMFSPQSAIARMVHAMKDFWEMEVVCVTQGGRGSTVTKVSEERIYGCSADYLCREEVEMLPTIETNRMMFQNL